MLLEKLQERRSRAEGHSEVTYGTGQIRQIANGKTGRPAAGERHLRGGTFSKTSRYDAALKAAGTAFGKRRPESKNSANS